MKPKAMLFLGMMLLALCVFAQTEVELFPFETFDSWVTPATPPTAWTRIVGGDEATPLENGNDWHPFSGASEGGTWSTLPVARIHWSPEEVADDYLVTPSFDPTTATFDSVVLEYETDYSWWDVDPGTGDNYVLLSIDGGTTWPESLYTYGISSGIIHETRRIDITSLVGGHADCKVAFWERRNTTNEVWWSIDNIVVYGYEAPAEPSPPLFYYTCETTLPGGTSSHTFEVNIDDVTGVNPSTAEFCYSINGTATTCAVMTYVTGAGDGLGDYSYNLAGLNDWDQVVYYFQATDTYTPSTPGTSDPCTVSVLGDYYVYEDGTGLPMSPDPTWIDCSSGFELTAWEADDVYGSVTGMVFNPVFYGVEHAMVWLSSNGWMHLGTTSPGGSYRTPEDIPTAGGSLDGMLAFLWSDLIGSDAISACYYDDDLSGDYFLLSFDNWRVFGYTGTYFNVQIQVWHPDVIVCPGGNCAIDVRFNVLPPVLDEFSMGVENYDGSVGAPYMYVGGAMASPDYFGLTTATRTIRYCTVPPPEGGELYGYVTLSGRSDHSGATVGIVGTGLSGTTDASGYYEVSRVPEGTNDVYCTHPAFFEDTAFGLIFVEGSRTRQDFTLDPRPTGYIAGYADLTDTPGADINIACEGLGTVVNDLTDVTGLFVLDGVDVGDNQVVAQYAGYDIAWSPMTAVAPGETTWIDTIFLNPIPVDSLEDDGDGGVPDPLAGGWEWGTPTVVGPTAAYSGANCWGTDLEAAYAVNAHWKLDVEIPFPSMEFSWWQWIDMEDGFSVAYDGGNMKVSTDDGLTWTIAAPLDTAYNFPFSILNPYLYGEDCWSDDDGVWDEWIKQSIALTPNVTHVRFDFASDASLSRDGWYVDDFSFMVSPTGMLQVFVYDCNTYETIEGALVYAPGNSGYTGPDGSVMLDNIQYGDVTVNAGIPGYWPNHKEALVFIDEVTTLLLPICPIDVDEITGQLDQTEEDSLLFELCNPTEDTVWYHFTGVPGSIGGARARVERPIEEAKPGFIEDSAAKFAMNCATSTSIDRSESRMRPSDVGAVIDSYSIPETNLPWGFGIEGRLNIDRVWVSERHEIGGTITQVQNMAWNYPAWAYSGIVWDIGRIHWPDLAPDIAWFVDMAWDANRNVMWQIESDTTYKIYAWDPNTGEIVDSLGGPWAANWQRGLGYDFARDVFYIGSWSTNVIYEVMGPSWDTPGEILNVFAAPACGGIAFDPGRRTIWYADAGAVGLIYEIDPSTGDIINTIAAPHSELGGLAGLDMDYQGRLWVMNFAIPRIYVIEAPASVLPGGMYVDPISGYIAPGECQTFALVNPAYANPAGDYDFDAYFYPDPNLEPTLIPVSVQILPKAPRGWSLISVPVIANPNDPFIQFMDDITPFDVDHTVSNIWGWNQDAGIYEMPTGFNRGRGYYLKTWLEGTFWDVYGAPYASGDFTYPVYYPEESPSWGWWLIGNPYNKRVDWDAVYAATDFTYIHPEYWTWSQKEGFKSYSPILGGHGEDNLIDSWVGYFIDVLPGNPMTYTNIIYPEDGTMETFTAKIRPTVKKVKTANPEEFALRVSVSAINSSDRRYDTYNYISVNNLAIDGYGDYDIREPSVVPPSGAIKAFFENSGLRLMRNTKENFNLEFKDWDFVVRDLPAGMTVTLTWPKDRVPSSDDVSCGVDNLDRRWNLQMTDISTGTTIDMREVYSYTFTSTSGARRFTMTLGDVPLNIDDAKLPTEYALSANKPNPFNATTEFTVALPEKAHVKVEVFNLLGKKVNTIVDSEKEAGYQRVIWNGRDAQGRDVPSGLYLYKVSAGDFRQTRKMTLIK
ncbi:T9SS type A sorting domain-containing protein [bacterium]|nr:T9SS type A sorting domain-containing protein [bacterium]